MTKQEILDYFKDINHMYNDPNPYNDLSYMIDKLLENQEPVKPKQEKAILDYQSWHYVCGDCEKPIDIQDNFCRHCGRPIEHP